MSTFKWLSPMLLLCVTVAFAQDPHPQPKPGPSMQTLSSDGITTTVVTPESPLPAGQNFLMTQDSNAYDSTGAMMPNTEPSRPGLPFNLMSTPVVTKIDPESPSEDLDRIFHKVMSQAKHQQPVDRALLQRGISILEGDSLPDAPLYNNFALLHYTAPDRIKQVQPTYDASGKINGGNVNIHQIWFDSHIESDTSMIDPGPIDPRINPAVVGDVTWTITYTVDVLRRGEDDFANYIMYFDAPPANPATGGLYGSPNVGMDGTFYPMQEGHRYVFTISMAPPKYFNLVYTWGWRVHPPRVQVNENARKMLGGMSLANWEISTFGQTPRLTAALQAAAIAQIGELAPEKIMWSDLHAALAATSDDVIAAKMNDALMAEDDFLDRTHLPRGVTADPNADVTLFYANNTIYGNVLKLNNWTQRGQTIHITLLNGDHFIHSYMNVDFGGSRGWENQFQSGYDPDPSKAASDGCTFSFGRNFWWINAGGPWGLINVPPVDPTTGTPGLHKVALTLNLDPPGRLKIYQFDPLHHEMNIYSLH